MKVIEGTEIFKLLPILVHAAQPMLPHDSFLASVTMTNLGIKVTQKKSDAWPWCVI